MQHCHVNTCQVASCDVPDPQEARLPVWRLGLEAVVDAANRLHHYRNLRARMFSQAMHRFDDEDRS